MLRHVNSWVNRIRHRFASLCPGGIRNCVGADISGGGTGLLGARTSDGTAHCVLGYPPSCCMEEGMADAARARGADTVTKEVLSTLTCGDDTSRTVCAGRGQHVCLAGLRGRGGHQHRGRRVKHEVRAPQRHHGVRLHPHHATACPRHRLGCRQRWRRAPVVPEHNKVVTLNMINLDCCM